MLEIKFLLLPFLTRITGQPCSGIKWWCMVLCSRLKVYQPFSLHSMFYLQPVEILFKTKINQIMPILSNVHLFLFLIRVVKLFCSNLVYVLLKLAHCETFSTISRIHYSPYYQFELSTNPFSVTFSKLFSDVDVKIFMKFCVCLLSWSSLHPTHLFFSQPVLLRNGYSFLLTSILISYHCLFSHIEMYSLF